MRASLLICAIWLCACASGKPGAPDGGGGGIPDTNVSTFEDAGIDAPPKNGFGEPCTTNLDCESGLCILVGTSGQCTETCGDCPPGYGCLGVTGIQIEGQVTFVCVPTSNQLCTTCTQHSECTLIGMDKCVEYPDGDKACAQDCSKIGCPVGYTCQDVEIDGVDYKQCMAESMACDCTAENPGAMQPCNIMTPWNVCVGAQTCGGASGWGACEPPSMTDDPDATYTDDNCDGIDGDMAKAIFVAGGGSNSGTCGLTYMTPCQTISHGITRALQTSRPHVYVQAGTYNEVVVLASGVHVFGGYDFNWKRGPHSDAAHRVTIVGGQDNGTNGDGEYLAVRAHGLLVPVTLADLVIQGPNAVGTTQGGAGRSSYAIHLDGGKVNLARVRILAGNGAPGSTGSPGADAVVVDRQNHMNGAMGGAGEQFTTFCNNSSYGGGGAPGTNSCSQSPSERDMDGGKGGNGGTMDTDCSFPSYNFNARPGSNGSSADYTTGSFGLRGLGGSGGDNCGPTTSGNAGLVVNGSAGSSGGSGGFVSGGYWYARSGTAGGTGQNGSGGGGGGGAGGCDDDTDSFGAGGSGGGAGGCAARGGGGGGGGGGGSFGIFAVNASQLTVSSCEIVRGVGGRGGDGGTGGRGQSGGLGGASNPTHPGGATPGAGGNGAHGGHGGGGGGGTGGVSVGIGYTSDTQVTGSCMTTGGAAGAGGSGGVSAPTAPVGERDGNNGASGNAGSVHVTRVCTSLSSC